MTNLINNIKPANDTHTLTSDEEYALVYEHLLSNVREIKSDPNLAEFLKPAYRELEKFEENYPEIVSEYRFSHN